jgi:hypothetical protein
MGEKLVEVLFRGKNKSALFFYKNKVYEIRYEDALIVVDEIKKKIKEYKKLMRSLVNEMSALGITVIITSPEDKNPFELKLEEDIKEILKRYSVKNFETLDKYFSNNIL